MSIGNILLGGMPCDEFVLTYAKQRNIVSCNPRSDGCCQVCPNLPGYCVKPTNVPSGSKPVLVESPPKKRPTYCPDGTVRPSTRTISRPTTTRGANEVGFVKTTTESPQVFEKN